MEPAGAPDVGHLGYRAVVMILDEARSHIGSGVLYCTAADEAHHAVIARVLGSWVFVRCSSDNRIKSAAREGRSGESRWSERQGPPCSLVGAGVAYRGFLPGSFSLELRFPGCLYLCIPGVLLGTY